MVDLRRMLLDLRDDDLQGVKAGGKGIVLLQKSFVGLSRNCRTDIAN